MNYDEELEYLRKEFKKSEAKFHEAEREGWHTDANIYEDNMANLGYQIHIHEQAAKADEYEAKAKAFDFIREARKEVLTDVRERGLKLPTDLDKFSMMTERIINKYESGGYDA